MYRLGPSKKEIDLLGEFMEHNIGRKRYKEQNENGHSCLIDWIQEINCNVLTLVMWAPWDEEEGEDGNNGNHSSSNNNNKTAVTRSRVLTSHPSPHDVTCDLRHRSQNDKIWSRHGWVTVIYLPWDFSSQILCRFLMYSGFSAAEFAHLFCTWPPRLEETRRRGSKSWW